MISLHIPLLQLVFLTSTLMMLFACSTISAQAAAETTSAPVQLAFEVLSSFKQAITSDPNQALASWNTSNNSNPCTSNWNGISCEFLSPNTTDFITGISINLTGLSLGGTLTPNLTRLTVLTYLDLTLNEISGTFTFLSNFSSIRSLQYLSFARNKFYGAFTLPTSCFPNLLFLSVAENKLSGSIPYNELMRCSSLQSLNVSTNHFTGSFFPSGLGPNLTSTLRSIDAGANGLTGSIPESIGNCSDLTFLSFPSNNFSGEFPASIGRGCPKLSFLSLFNNNMTGSIPKEFGLLSQLSYISIGLNNFSGQIFKLVLNCTNLTTLDISRMSITGRMPDDLGLRLPNLMFLNLEQNMLTGSIPASLGNCSKLINLLVGFNDNMTEMKILIGVIGAAAIASTCVAAVLLLTSRRRQGRKLRTAWDFYPYIRLSLEEIKHATGDFSAENAIGSGVTGTVYKGILRNGTTLAFKKFNLDSSSIRSFMREIESVGSIRHRNLIRIFGYFSNQQDHDILILEYMPNGSLHDHLHSNKARESLSWEARLRVAIHVGEGLLYMHNDCPSPIIHCDLKPQNILFDANMEVRISDFGLAKMIADTASTSSFTENVRGTLGYMAPEVASSGHISRKCDVYSFGILLIELITGRKPFEEVHMQSEDGEDQSTTTLVRWVSVTLQSGGKILDIVDSEIRHACAESKEVIDQAQKLLNVAFHCTEENPNRRPEMQQVVRRVQSIAGYNTSAVEYHGDPEGREVDGRSQAFDQK